LLSKDELEQSTSGFKNSYNKNANNTILLDYVLYFTFTTTYYTNAVKMMSC